MVCLESEVSKCTDDFVNKSGHGARPGGCCMHGGGEVSGGCRGPRSKLLLELIREDPAVSSLFLRPRRRRRPRRCRGLTGVDGHTFLVLLLATCVDDVTLQP